MKIRFGIMVAMKYDKEDIKTFVKQTLGCACPEELFEYIDFQSNIQLNDTIVVRNKINIGNRLLIYVVEVNNPDSIEYVLPFLVDIGKKDRDSLRCNRFRLVFATDRLDEIKQVADSLFKTIDKDERIHLHIVSKDDLPILSRYAFDNDSSR